MRKLYFLLNVSEICYDIDYFKNLMTSNGISEMKVFRAEPERWNDVFWCRSECFCGDKSMETCGKQCLAYKPRNGKSGCCRYYSKILYYPSEQITINHKTK